MQLKKIYNLMEVFDNHVLLDDEKHNAVIGKHCVWLPELEVKIIWTVNGRAEAYRDWDKGANAEILRQGLFNTDFKGFDIETIQSILSEYLIFEELSKNNMSPKVDGFLFIKNVISRNIFGIDYCDSTGMYGYYFQNANKLKQGSFTGVRFLEIASDFKIIIPEQGALGDLSKEDNRVNGYLIDLRRTIWAMIRLDKPYNEVKRLWKEIKYKQDKQKLKEKIIESTQFPYKQRKQNYQSYLLGNSYEEGSRNTQYRFAEMKVEENLFGKTVVDLGCNLGSMCFEAVNRGARKVTGIDGEINYIDCARDVARYNGMAINFLQMDLNNPDSIIKQLKMYYQQPISIIFALALTKHIGDNLWAILNGIDWEICYVESHNAPEGLETPHVIKMISFMSVFDNVKYLGMVNDRSPRCIWKLQK